ncbi:MAG: GNAT family N-acetyltransferase [Planctomycetota bacterium]|jgi:GNAT superfamily N-acetyltransferase|nr:GNAT family N-acetyltransferase [Planctomycetota bacterium]
MPDSPEVPEVFFNRAELSDQGRLCPLLMQTYGQVLENVLERSRSAAFPSSSVEDELMAADDFYFSAIDLMDCCWLAKAGNDIIGAACVNPYVSELQYVAVLPEWRRKGIGGKLVELALAELVKRGVDHVRCELALALADDGGRMFLANAGMHEIASNMIMGRSL